MSTLNDLKCRSLRQQGFQGSLDDMLISFYKERGVDGEYMWLANILNKTGSLNDLRYEYLISQGFTGSHNDMLLSSLSANQYFNTFTPISLFSAGEQGGWYDPSDFSTMFQDAAGTTPVTAVEQPVGLILDKSKGLVLEPKPLNNPSFDSGIAGWTSGSATTSTIIAGQVDITSTNATSFGFIEQGFLGTAGATYEVRVDCEVLTGTCFVGAWTGTAAQSTTFSDAGRRVRKFLFSAANTAPTVRFGGINTIGASLRVYGVELYRILGNHATQTTSTSRPVLSARVNLLTKTEEFDDAAWVKNSVTVTPNAATAPDGAATAEKIIPNPATAQFYVIQNAQFVSGVSYTISTALKKAGYRYAQLTLPSAVAGINQYANFDLEAGSITFQTGGTASIVDLGQGWYRCSWTAAVSTTLVAGVGAVVIINDGNAPRVPSFTGDGTSGIYIWGASLVPANQADLPYQRVNTATDYDTTGFPLYLKFDGVDDWLITPTITPGVDKAQVFAGVRKLSDAATGVLVESSATVAANAGSFVMAAPNNTGASGNYSMYSRGNIAPSTSANSAITLAPVTSVVSGFYDISGDTMRIRVNGGGEVTNTADQGTGNYLAYPLYIGRRGGTTLPFNGHLYGLVVRFGANLPAGTISSAETWVAGKTGITL